MGMVLQLVAVSAWKAGDSVRELFNREVSHPANAVQFNKLGHVWFLTGYIVATHLCVFCSDICLWQFDNQVQKVSESSMIVMSRRDFEIWPEVKIGYFSSDPQLVVDTSSSHTNHKV